LDEDGDLHFAAALDLKYFRIGGLLDAQGDVGADFLLQPLPNVPRGHEFAVLAGERAVVYGKFHLNRRRINRNVRQRAALRFVGNRLTDEHVLKTGNADDVARVRLRHFDAFEALEVVNHRDFALGDLTV